MSAQTSYPDVFCSDGWDNDGDGRTDYPDDPGCRNGSDDTEYDDDRFFDGRYHYDRHDRYDRYDDRRYSRALCDDGYDNDGDGDVDYPDDPGCRDRYDDSEGGDRSYRYDRSYDRYHRSDGRYACDDGYDNDGDGDIDYPEDAGCSSYDDDHEENRSRERGRDRRAVCDDGYDNDGDGDVDYPDDSGCRSRTDDSEYDDDRRISDSRYECSDYRDNDGDGDVDYPEDRGCASRGDDNEDSDDYSVAQDLRVTISADRREVLPGDVVTYTIVVRNEHDRAAEDIRVDAAYDRAVATVLDADDGQINGSRVRWIIGRMQAGARQRLTYRIRLDDALPVGRAITSSVTAHGTLGTATDEEHIRILGTLPQAGIHAAAPLRPAEFLTRVKHPLAHATATSRDASSMLWTSGAGASIGGFLLMRNRRRT